MGRAFATRVIDAIPTVLLVLTLVFLALRVLPGDPALVALGENATADQLALFRHRMGLDVPLWRQYLVFMTDLARLNFGTSFMNQMPITVLLAASLPFTLALTAAAAMVGVVLGVPLGVVAATRRGKAADSLARVFALLGFTVPDFYLGALLLIELALNLEFFPINGAGDGFIDQLYHLILPAVTLGLIKAAFISRLTRSALLEVLGRDYVRTAWAKGARERRVVYRHALRNALLPISTGLSISILSTLSGSVAIELIFGRPGLGSLLIGAIETRDYPVVQAALEVFALLVVVVLTLWIATAIRLEATLSFLGLGTQAPAPSWGNIIRDGLNNLFASPWPIIAAGAAISITVLGFNLLGDAVRDVLDVENPL